MRYFVSELTPTCPNHHEEVYLVGWEGKPQPISPPPVLVVARFPASERVVPLNH